MSISRPSNTLTRPVKKYIKFKGGDDDGYFSYWEKYDIKDPRYTQDTKGEEVEFDLGDFIVVDGDLLTVTGYEEGRGNIWSNEVRSVEDTLIVRFHGEKKPIAKGDWAYVKTEVGKDGKFTKSIYIQAGNGQFVNLHLSGASLTSWFNDIEGNKHMMGTHVIRVKEIQSGKKGAVKYKYPVFEFGDEIPKERLDQCVEFDSDQLQPYLDKYLEGGSTKDASDSTDRTDDSATDLSSWRDYKSREGTLGLMPMSAVATLKTTLEETGMVETPEYDNVCQALKDYQDAKQVWQDKVGKAGKLGDMELDQLRELFDKVMELDPKHVSRIYIEAGMQQRISEQEEESAESNYGDDDIPF